MTYLTSFFRCRKTGLSIWECDEGVTVVETVIIFPPLMMLTFAALEICLLYVASNAFNLAVSDVSRQIQTEILDGSSDIVQARNTLCDRVILFGNSDCSSHVILNVQSYSTLADAINDPVTKGTVKLTNAYEPGDWDPCVTCNDIVVVKATWRWDIVSPPLWAILSNNPEKFGQQRVGMTRVFVNEKGLL